MTAPKYTVNQNQNVNIYNPGKEKPKFNYLKNFSIVVTLGVIAWCGQLMQYSPHICVYACVFATARACACLPVCLSLCACEYVCMCVGECEIVLSVLFGILYFFICKRFTSILRYLLLSSKVHMYLDIFKLINLLLLNNLLNFD